MLPGRATTRQALDLTAFEQFPHFRATLRSDVRRRGQRRSQATPLPAPTPLIRPNPTVPPRRSPPAGQLPAVQQARQRRTGGGQCTQDWLPRTRGGTRTRPGPRPGQPVTGAPRRDTRRPGAAPVRWRRRPRDVSGRPAGEAAAGLLARRGDLDGAMHAGLHGMPAVTASTRRSLDPHRQGIQ